MSVLRPLRRTPLNAAMGLLSLLLEEGDLSATTRDYVATSLASCSGLLGLISQMIEFAQYDAESQSEAGAQVVFEEQTFEIGAVAEEVIDILGAKANKASTELILDIRPDIRLLSVIGDRVRLRQVCSETNQQPQLRGRVLWLCAQRDAIGCFVRRPVLHACQAKRARSIRHFARVLSASAVHR